jgi:hypothetical protein
MYQSPNKQEMRLYSFSKGGQFESVESCVVCCVVCVCVECVEWIKALFISHWEVSKGDSHLFVFWRNQRDKSEDYNVSVVIHSHIQEVREYEREREGEW